MKGLPCFSPSGTWPALYQCPSVRGTPAIAFTPPSTHWSSVISVGTKPGSWPSGSRFLCSLVFSISVTVNFNLHADQALARVLVLVPNFVHMPLDLFYVLHNVREVVEVVRLGFQPERLERGHTVIHFAVRFLFTLNLLGKGSQQSGFPHDVGDAEQGRCRERRFDYADHFVFHIFIRPIRLLIPTNCRPSNSSACSPSRTP